MNTALQTVSLSGRVLAIVPLDQYDDLREALEDAADAETMRRVRADPNEEDIPVEMARRLWNGEPSAGEREGESPRRGEPSAGEREGNPLASESPVRVWREMRGLKASALAEAAGLSRSYLSAIERGEKQGSVGALKRLAEALGVGIEDLT